MPRPLDGLLVLDLTRLLPGPFATLQLADLGARILKIEDPKGGDYARYFPPLGGKMSAAFAALNRDKEGIALDLKKPASRAAFLRLVDQADVLIESFRPDVMPRLGLGHAELRARNPRLIYCAISGYGQDGPLAERAGHDLNYLAIAGLLGLTGRGGVPVQPGIQAADIAGGALYAVIGILAALNERHRTGEGRLVDVSMTDGVAGFGIMMHAAEHFGEPAGAPGESLLAGGRPAYRLYACADGETLAVGALEPKFWMKLCAAIGRPDLMTDGLATGARRAKVEAELEALFRTKTRAAWADLLAAHDVCAEPALSLTEARQHAHAAARGLFGTHAHPAEGVAFLHQHPNPKLLPGAEPPPPTPAPRLGEHTRAVLTEFGAAEDEIAAVLRGG